MAEKKKGIQFFKRAWEKSQKKWEEEREFQKKLAKKRKEAYRETLLIEKVRTAKAVAKAEADVALAKYHARIGYTPETTIVKRIKRGRGKEKKIIKKIIRKRGKWTPPTRKADSEYFQDLTRGMPA